MAAETPERLRIIDTHQHLWDLSWQKLPWLAGAPEVLQRSYLNEDYAEAMQGYDAQAIYMEVDIDPSQHVQEAEYIEGLIREGEGATIASVIGGRPDADHFGDYLDQVARSPHVKGVRQVLHGDKPKGHCLRPEFVRGIRLLGERNLCFDLCMRAEDLGDALQLVEQCPGTRFVLDHCGNPNVGAFAADADAEARQGAEAWRRDIERLAGQPNVICKISGILVTAPQGWSAEDVAPVVNHCLDAFGPDRVVYGGDWPVCLLGGTPRQWIEAVRQIIRPRPAADQEKLWWGNAVRYYALES